MNANIFRMVRDKSNNTYIFVFFGQFFTIKAVTGNQDKNSTKV